MHLPLLHCQLHLCLNAEQLPIIIAYYFLVLLGLGQHSLYQHLFVSEIVGLLL